MHDLFFWISKLVWLFISPYSQFLFWLIVGILLVHRNRIALGKSVLTTLAMATLFTSIFPVGEWVLNPLEIYYPNNPVIAKPDGIIVLAAAEQPALSNAWDQVVLSEEADRILHFMALARRFPAAKLVFAGGIGDLLNQNLKGADVAKRLLSEQGIDVSRVYFERNSRNTYESAMLSKRLIEPKPDETWVLITSAAHMYRSINAFCKLGWNLIPYPVDFETRRDIFRFQWDLQRSLHLLSKGLHEWVGILAYRLSNRSC